MAVNNANASRNDVHETQLPSSSLLEGVYLDEDERPLRHDRSESGMVNGFTSVGDTYRLGDTVDPDNILSPESAIQQAAPAAKRVLAPDLLRGFVMVLQAVDHAAVFSTAYSHGQAIIGEKASEKADQWNESVGYALRLMSHLCAPGFMFLLGMGVAYFARSRAKVGWSATRMLRHFLIRAVIMILINWMLSTVVLKRLRPVLNIVLLALAFNYLLIGLIWLATTWTEPRLARVILSILPRPSRNPDTRSLLSANSASLPKYPDLEDKARRVSFHVHNSTLLIVSVITVWWNIWLDPFQGRCPAFPDDPSNIVVEHDAWFEFFFHEFKNKWVFSGLPPMAWLSPTVWGLVYARLTLARPWKPLQINVANIATGTSLLLLFVLTRLFHFGNLNEDCLAMPEHLANPDTNQYLVSARSFFYITKYPPSPSYIFFTMGCNLLVLGLFGFIPIRATKHFPFSVLTIFGTTALFFFVLHMPLYQVLGAVAKQLFGHKMDFNDPMRPGSPAWGVGPGIIFWVDLILGLLILWRVCQIYAEFKATKGANSVWRFF